MYVMKTQNNKEIYPRSISQVKQWVQVKKKKMVMDKPQQLPFADGNYFWCCKSLVTTLSHETILDVEEEKGHRHVQ